MTERNIIRMVEEIQKKVSSLESVNGVDSTLIAEVESVEPLTIKMYNLSITGNIYVNPALMLEASDTGEKMKKVFHNSFQTREAYEFLKKFHESFVLRKGDAVIVHITGSSFYIAGKAVKV